MTVSLQPISLDDAETLWAMQRRAFAALLERYRDYDTNPACETLARVREKVLTPGRYYYFVVYEGQRVGAICVHDAREPGCVKRISPLFILPEYRGQGLGQAAIQAAERQHGSRRWSLETILEEAGNCHLYEKMGYRQTGETMKVNERMTLVAYEKP